MEQLPKSGSPAFLARAQRLSVHNEASVRSPSGAGASPFLSRADAAPVQCSLGASAAVATLAVSDVGVPIFPTVVPPSEMAAAAALAAAVPGPGVWSAVPPLNVGGAGLGAKADGGAEQAASPKKRVRTDAHKARDNATKKAKKEREKQERADLFAELETLRLRNAELGIRLQAVAPEDRALQAERNEQKAVRLQEAAVAHSARLQSRVNSLASELATSRAAAATAAKEMRAADRNAATARAETDRLRAEHKLAVDSAVAHTFQETERVAIRERRCAGASLLTAERDVNQAKKLAAVADARASAAEAALYAANMIAAAAIKDARGEKRRAAEDGRQVRAGTATAIADAVSAATAACLAIECDSDAAASTMDCNSTHVCCCGCSSSSSSSSSSSKREAGDDGWSTSDDCAHTKKRKREQRTEKQRVIGMQAATSGASYAEVQRLAVCSDALAPIADRRFLQRMSSDARIIGLLLHGMDLCSAVKRLSVKGDGFSGHDWREGMVEYMTYTHTLKTARGKIIDLPVDGFLLSIGLTAEDEARLCDLAIDLLKAVVKVLREKYVGLYGDGDDCLKWLRESNVDLAGFSHVGADGANAAQKWARLMRDRVQGATRARFSDDEWKILTAVQQRHELYVLATKCGIHGGVLGFTHASKAAAAITTKLGAAAVQSVRNAGHASDHFAHSLCLKQALHTGGKLLGSSNGYAHGKAFFLLCVARRPQFATTEFFSWPRQNGSRFFQGMRMCAPFLRSQPYAHDALAELQMQLTLSKAVSSYWSQLNSPILLLEARLSEAMMAALGEPTQVLLGQAAFTTAGGSGENGGGENDDGGCGGVWSSKIDFGGTGSAFDDSDGTSEGGGSGDAADFAAAAEGLVQALREEAEPFLAWHAQAPADGRTLKHYRADVPAASRVSVAEAARAASTAEAEAALGGCDCGWETALAIIDDGGSDEPHAATCGIWQTVDVLAGLVRAARAFAEQPSAIFDGRRPSARLAPYIPEYAHAYLVQWEERVYKRKGRNAHGAVVNESTRAAADVWRKEPPALCAHLESDGTRDKYGRAMFTAAADEWEKYFSAAFDGDDAAGCRAGWRGSKLEGASFDTARVESNNGAVKQIMAKKQTASHSRIASNVLASNADLWGRWDAVSPKLQSAMLAAVPALRLLADEFTATCKVLNAAAETERKGRQQKAAVRAAAQKYAVAQALYSFELWPVAKLGRELQARKFKYQKLEALEQQLQIVTTGYGFSECAVSHQKSDVFCAFCGTNVRDSSKLQHLEEHAKAAIRFASERGKPAGAPLPDVCTKHGTIAPVLDEDQSTNPMHKVLAQLSEEAKAMAPKIAIAVAPVLSAGASAPVFGKALVGMVVEYVFRIAEPGARKKKSQLYTYQGYIKGIEVVNRGKKDEHALAVCLWPTTLVDGVFVEEPEEEACMLFADLYGKTGVSGWVVYKGKLEVDAAAEHSGAEVQDLDAKMDQAAINAALLCAPITSG